jgi:Helix-turn-helix domain
MTRRVIELEAEVADWLEQLLTARFAVVAFAIHLIASYGALRADPRVQNLGGRFPPMHVMRFYADTDPMGLSYWCAPGHRTVILTVWRTACISEAAETARARRALRRCVEHSHDPHRGWAEIRGRRMSEPGAADSYRQAADAHAFGQAVHLRRERHHLSVDELATAASTTGSLITRCETGGLMPTTPLAARIATALSCEHILVHPSDPPAIPA